MILLLVILGVRVGLARRGTKVLLGDPGKAAVLLASRVFGNATEYIPAAIGALTILTLLGLPAWVLHALGALLLLGANPRPARPAPEPHFRETARAVRMPGTPYKHSGLGSSTPSPRHMILT